MAIADDDIERLRETISLVDIVQGYVPLRRVGRNWVGLCPFHKEKSPSFSVNAERQFADQTDQGSTVDPDDPQASYIPRSKTANDCSEG